MSTEKGRIRASTRKGIISEHDAGELEIKGIESEHDAGEAETS